MNVSNGPLSGLVIIEPRIFRDDRGYFYESYQQQRYRDLGLPEFVQDNVSRSKKGVLRGLHYQLPNPQGKLVGVTRGEVWDVVIDIRQSSPTFGRWFGITLSEANGVQMYVPPGFAHGFCVTSNEADFYYKCTNFYTPAAEQGVIWNDERTNIPWPVEHPILSPKDLVFSPLHAIPKEKLFD